MKGSVIYLDKDQLKLINLIDEWLKYKIINTPAHDADWLRNLTNNNTINDSRTFLTHLYEKGWYREESEEQGLLKELRNEWIEDGGKWKS